MSDGFIAVVKAVVYTKQKPLSVLKIMNYVLGSVLVVMAGSENFRSCCNMDLKVK